MTIENQRASRTTWLRKYIWLHAVLVAFPYVATVCECYLGVWDGLVYRVAGEGTNMTGVLMAILPIVTVWILWASHIRGREWLYFGVVDAMLCVLHAVAGVALMQ